MTAYISLDTYGDGTVLRASTTGDLESRVDDTNCKSFSYDLAILLSRTMMDQIQAAFTTPKQIQTCNPQD